ncbi:ATP-binding protein [Pseudomonas farsensis]|uniref:ATP-binding protein n=1 Tax=Pseudomonas farsensis TaxID=2745492 RepID=UPI001CEDFE6C|nr:ATP-binding protein [Pseudomonas farsensis]
MKTLAADDLAMENNIQVIHLAPLPAANESIAGTDWSRTPLGPLAKWSATLRIAVDMLHLSPFPCALVWGSDLSVIHNDAYPIQARQGCAFHGLWGNAWAVMGAAVFQALEGQGSITEVLLPIDQQQTRFTCCYSPIRDEQGAVAGFVHTLIAASASAEAASEWRERALSFEAQLASYLADSQHTWQLSPDVMLMLDDNQQVRMANPAWQRLLGWTAQSQPATPLSELVHPAERTDCILALTALYKGGAASTFEARMRHAEGHYCWFSWTTLAGQTMPMLVGRDITETRKSIQRLAEAAVRDSQRMESVVKVAGSYGHQMNNVLSGVSSSLEWLERRLLQGRTERLEDYVKMARDCAERAIGLTHNLLAFARSQPLSPSPLDVSRLMREAEPMLRQALSGDIHLEWQLDSAPWPVQLDPDQLRNALMHLCANASEACLGRGKVQIRSYNERLSYTAEQPSGLPAGDYVVIQVEDDGHGMSGGTSAHAFEPFFTTKEMGHGVGLGLAMVHGFVHQSGGQVWLESKLGHGTRVVMMFPRYQGSVPVQPELQPKPMQAHGERLLLIDDEVNLRALMKEALVDRGYEVSDAPDANTALGAYRSAGPFELVITDIGLPGGFNGRQVARALRMLDPGQKILFITGYTEEPVEQHVLDQPGTALLYKPFSLDTLCRQVQHMLHE